MNDGWGSWTFLEMRPNEEGTVDYVWRTDESGNEFVTSWLYFTHEDDWRDRQLPKEVWVERAKAAEARLAEVLPTASARVVGSAFPPRTSDQILSIIRDRVRHESLHREESAWADAYYDIALLLLNTKVVSE